MVHDDIHEGVQKTLHRFRCDIHTPYDRRAVQDFVKACIVCERNKMKHLQPIGPLLPLPVPSAAWSDISMEFVEGFPRIAGKSVILTVVDRFSKYGALHHTSTSVLRRIRGACLLHRHGPTAQHPNVDHLRSRPGVHQAAHVVSVSPPIRWSVGGCQQGDHHVPPLPRGRSAAVVDQEAALSGVRLQHVLPLGVAGNAISCGIWPRSASPPGI